MPDTCTCAAMHSRDYSQVHDHCMRYFLPEDWAYDGAPGKDLPPSLLLKGRCTKCGGSLVMGMPLRPAHPGPEARYYDLYQNLRTWRPYAISESGQAYPAAAQRLNWYQRQDERTEREWGEALTQMLPRSEARDAHFWLSGYQKRGSQLAGQAWPVGSSARFKGGHEVDVSPYIGAAKGKRIFVRPFQELKITSAAARPEGIAYSGLIKAEGETFYLERVTEDRLYSQAEWAALQLGPDFAPAVDFKRQYPPDPLPPLFALTRMTRTEGAGTAGTLAVSAHRELLKARIRQDAGEHMVLHGPLLQEGSTGGAEQDPDSNAGSLCRWTVRGEKDAVLEYCIERVPVLAAQIVSPDTGM